MCKVLINDSNFNLDYARMRIYFMEAADWARQSCPSFIDYDVIDTSDVSPIFDQIAEYKFTDEKEAFLFELKWRR